MRETINYHRAEFERQARDAGHGTVLLWVQGWPTFGGPVATEEVYRLMAASLRVSLAPSRQRKRRRRLEQDG